MDSLKEMMMSNITTTYIGIVSRLIERQMKYCTSMHPFPTPQTTEHTLTYNTHTTRTRGSRLRNVMI
jgi:hypothetical protein